MTPKVKLEFKNGKISFCLFLPFILFIPNRVDVLNFVSIIYTIAPLLWLSIFFVLWFCWSTFTLYLFTALLYYDVYWCTGCPKKNTLLWFFAYNSTLERARNRSRSLKTHKIFANIRKKKSERLKEKTFKILFSDLHIELKVSGHIKPVFMLVPLECPRSWK